ncbi:hypothetical protein AMJ80_07785 [bacterium SM23_31]|nr:MAG: hypothetical protein AMJ80_07785 [bacterium SM23_31]
MGSQIPLLFNIKPSSGVPIYKQIMEQINRLVISGFLKAGDELPSVRQAASYLEVNPMTISKAYSLLEATSVLERVRGKGMIIAHDRRRTHDLDKRIEFLKPALIEAATQANQLALPRETILKLFSELLEEYTHE